MFDFLADKFSSVFTRLTGQHKLSEGNIQEAVDKIQEALLEADVPYSVVQEFIAGVKTEAMGQKVLSSLKPGEQFIKVVHDRLVSFLGQEKQVALQGQKGVVMVMGLQGSGKTTSLGKLARHLHKQAKKDNLKPINILLASVDFYRPAAIDQLEILAKQVGVPFYRSTQTDAVKAADDIYTYYKNNHFDLLLLDTAGRLHIDSAMLEQLREIDLRLKPAHKLLVLDAMTGQESLRVAKAFEQGVGFEGALLTKMDSEARAGAAVAFRYVLKKPIWFVGVGEKIDDLELFHADRAAQRLLGMGDLESLLERANEKVKEHEQEAAYKAFMSGNFTLQDFANQLSMMTKIGSLAQLTKLMPGMGAKMTPDQIEKGEVELKRFRAILSSMTPKERLMPAVLNGMRKQRIAKGAGVQVVDINALLARFEQSQQFAKLFKKFGRL